MRIEAAVIGGTGVGELLAALPGRAAALPTRAGVLRGRVVEFGGIKVFAVRRHAEGHRLPPHRVGYAAAALGLRALGVRLALSTAAVGSLNPEWGPGELVLPTDFIDFSGRNTTLFDREVRHTPMAAPFGAIEGALRRAGRELGRSFPERAVYGQTNGPRYETAAEIAALGLLGAQLVGMTAASEATAFAEAGIAYECLAIVTNFAQGVGGSVPAHGEVTASVASAAPEVMRLLAAACGQARFA